MRVDAAFATKLLQQIQEAPFQVPVRDAGWHNADKEEIPSHKFGRYDQQEGNKPCGYGRA
jgi:hypothetical protein